MRMKSFLSEHTIEFVIVPRLRSILARRLGSAMPVYFWKTREGNSLSNNIHKNEFVYVLAMFPRRPKLKSPNEKTLWAKINHELFEFAQASSSAGIPAIAGLPLARSLPELWKNREPMWIALASEYPEDVVFEVDVVNRNVLSVLPEGQKLKIITEDDISILVEEKANVMTWSEADAVINMLRTEQYRDDFSRRFFFFSRYKPVYFFCFQSLREIDI